MEGVGRLTALRPASHRAFTQFLSRRRTPVAGRSPSATATRRPEFRRVGRELRAYHRQDSIGARQTESLEGNRRLRQASEQHDRAAGRIGQKTRRAEEIPIMGAQLSSIEIGHRQHETTRIIDHPERRSGLRLGFRAARRLRLRSGGTRRPLGARVAPDAR
jgi:hypothetical protein